MPISLLELFNLQLLSDNLANLIKALPDIPIKVVYPHIRYIAIFQTRNLDVSLHRMGVLPVRIR